MKLWWILLFPLKKLQLLVIFTANTYWYSYLYFSISEAGDCADMEVSCTDNTVVVLGSVGAVMGLIILIQSVVLVILLLLPNKNTKAKKRLVIILVLEVSA